MYRKGFVVQIVSKRSHKSYSPLENGVKMVMYPYIFKVTKDTVKCKPSSYYGDGALASPISARLAVYFPEI